MIKTLARNSFLFTYVSILFHRVASLFMRTWTLRSKIKSKISNTCILMFITAWLDSVNKNRSCLVDKRDPCSKKC
jgi:hypothetical protein